MTKLSLRAFASAVTLVTLFCGVRPAQGALEMYADFEKPTSQVSAIGASSGSGRLSGGKPPTFVDGAPKALAGRSGKVLRFHGDGMVYFRDLQAPELSDAWSINVFMKFDARSNDQQTIIGRPGSWFWYINTGRATATFAPSGQDALTFPLPPDLAGRWVMLTLVKSGNGVHLLVDGKPQGRRGLKAELNSRGALYVGAASSTSGRAATGAMDDLSIWSHALTPGQIEQLLSGMSAVELASAGRLQREPTPPITAETPVRPIRDSLDAREAVIVLPEDGERALAERVQAVLADAWGVQLDLQPVTHHSDGDAHVILLGTGMGHPLSRELAGNQQIKRNIKGSELRIIPEAIDWGRGVVYLGGRDDAEVLAAAAELVKRFPGPDRLTFTIHSEAPVELPSAEKLVAEGRALYASRSSRKNSLILRDHLQPAFDAFLATGEAGYAEAVRDLMMLMAENYRDALPFSANMPPTFEFHAFAHYLYLLEHWNGLTDADRRQAAELMRQVSEDAMDSWEMGPPMESYAYGKQRYLTNHYMFASRTVANSARYLMDRYDMRQLRYFLAVAENTIDAAGEVPLSPEDAGGYQYLVYRIYTDYMLAAGKLDDSVFTDPRYVHYMDYAKMTVNHLGYTPGYGDANATGMRGPFRPLLENMEFTGDPESAAIVSLIGRSDGGLEFAGFYANLAREWDVPLDLDPPSDPRFLGLRIFTVDETRAGIIGLINTARPKLDKAIFRSSWDPRDAEFLAINGLNAAPHGHDDAIGVSQYVVGQHLWLTEGDYIRRYAEHHNLISVVRNGEAARRQRQRIPDIERFAQVVGSAQSDDRQAAATTLLLERNNGVNYYRHVGWETGGGFWVIDELEAVEPGDYRFASRWRTTGEVQPTPQGVLVRQKQAGPDDDLYHFSISEGTGATRWGYSQFERSHGRSTGNLQYNLSDRVTRTVLYWKDATLKPGERVLFANYFRALPGSPDVEPVVVEKLADNAFAVGTGPDRRVAVIGSFGGVEARALFTGPRGTVAVDAEPQAASAASRLLTRSGEVVANTTAEVPSGVARAALSPVHQFDAEISSTASGAHHVAVGTVTGSFHLLNPDGTQQASVKLPAEISAISAIATPGGEQWIVGTRPTGRAKDAPGALHRITAQGEVLWTIEIPGGRNRTGTPRSIFPAYLDGRDQPPSIIVGPASWRYTAFDLDGTERWFLEESIHGAMAGAAGDLNGDGRDEIFAGGEYYYQVIASPEGERLGRRTTSPRNHAAAIGDPGRKGINRVFAARSDGYLYSESLDTNRAPHWSANLGGPAHGIVLQDTGIVAATVNGTVVRLDPDGKRTRLTQLPAPLTDLQARGGSLFTPAMDGRIYELDAATLEPVKAWETGGYNEAHLHFPTLATSGDTVFAAFGNALYAVE